jgi:sugar phosphate isomerase/epimerase
MQLGIFAKTFEGASPGVVLPQVKAAGFGSAQYNFACSGLSAMPDVVPLDCKTHIISAAQKSAVKMVALSATYNMIHPDLQHRNVGLQRLAVAVEAAADMGIAMVTLCTGTRDPHDQWRHHPDNQTSAAWHDLLTAMNAAVVIADRFNVDLGIEPELANVINSAAQARRLIDTLKSPRIKIVFDAANLFEAEDIHGQRKIVADAVELLADHISMAHAKDRLANGQFTAAGTGVLDYPHFFEQLQQAGFNGPIVTHGLSAAEAPGVATFLKSEMLRAGLVISA